MTRHLKFSYISILTSLTMKRKKNLFQKECSVTKRCNIPKVFKQRKQLIWKLKFHADTAAIFSQMNRTLKFTIPWYLLHSMTSR